MQRILRHLDNIPLQYVAVLVVAALITAIVTPKKYRLGLAVFFLGAWTNLNRFSNLPLFASLSKVTFFLPTLLIVILTLVDKNKKNKVPKLSLVYLAMPLVGSFLISTTADRALGFIYMLNMALMALAAICLYRLCPTVERLNYVLVSLLMGLAVPLGFGVIGLIFFPSLSIIPGLGRLAPFGCNPNQFVPVLVLAVGLAAYTFVTTNKSIFKGLSIAIFSVSFALLVATGSRQGLVLILLIIIPFAAGMTRRPIVLALLSMVAIGGALWVFGYSGGGVSADRIKDLSSTSGRVENWSNYLEVIKRQPIFGLYGTSGQSIITASHESIRLSTHNAYLDLLYWGGITLAFPLFLLMFFSVISAATVVRKSRLTGIQPLGIYILATLLLSVYLHALVNQIPYVGVSSWTMMHFFLSCFFIGLARDLKEIRNPHLRTRVPVFSRPAYQSVT